MSAITKADLAQHLVNEMKAMSGKDAREIVNQFFEEIKKSLSQGVEVKLSGVGRFHLRDKKSRPGRNPKTGEVVLVSKRRVVAFSCAQGLREEVEKSLASTLGVE